MVCLAWKPLETVLNRTPRRYEWCIACIFIGLQLLLSDVLRYLHLKATKYQQSQQKLPFSRGYLVRLFHRETVFCFSSHNPAPLSDECLRESQVLALRFAPGYFAFKKVVGNWFDSRQKTTKTPPKVTFSLFFLFLFFLGFSHLNFRKTCPHSKVDQMHQLGFAPYIFSINAALSALEKVGNVGCRLI